MDGCRVGVVRAGVGVMRVGAGVVRWVEPDWMLRTGITQLCSKDRHQTSNTKDDLASFILELILRADPVVCLCVCVLHACMHVYILYYF